jgi:hypothetical protein
LEQYYSSTSCLRVSSNASLLLAKLVDSIWKAERNAVQQRLDIESIGESDCCDNNLTFGVLIKKLKDLLVFLRGSQRVVHLYSSKSMWSRGKRLPQIDKYTKDVVDRTAMDDCLATGVQIRQQLGKDLPSDTVLEGFHYKLSIGAFI